MLRLAALTLLPALLCAGCNPEVPLEKRLRQVPDADPERGRTLMTHYQCGTCHAAPGVPSAPAPVAPSLEGFGRRSYIAGRVPNGPSTLQRWLQDPPALVPGTTMPKLGVTAVDARDIAGYLLALE
ncbi:MAG TPA: cytochrome c [Albitalea sp.]|uniref:c-type cytochrome n=1 Tax=Piscinibacter sp. TaxID=1903157 RepID=UPI002ED5E0F5